MNPPPTLVDAWDNRAMIEAEAADLRRRFPGVVVWFGLATRRWWAMFSSAGRWHLVEANGPYDLRRLIGIARRADERPRPSRRHRRR